jgi:hypothetical protein
LQKTQLPAALVVRGEVSRGDLGDQTEIYQSTLQAIAQQQSPD